MTAKKRSIRQRWRRTVVVNKCMAANPVLPLFLGALKTCSGQATGGIGLEAVLQECQVKAVKTPAFLGV